MRASEKIIRAVQDTLPVMTGYVVLGIGFGILLSINFYCLIVIIPLFLAQLGIYRYNNPIINMTEE